MVRVVSVPPSHGLLPVEKHEHESARGVGEHHEYENRYLLGTVARYID